MNEWMSKGKWVNECLKGWVNEQTMNEQMVGNERMDGYMLVWARMTEDNWLQMYTERCCLLSLLVLFLYLAPYVKVYVMEGKRCLVKKKTRTARRTLEPLYQQQLEFKVEFTGKTLQASDIALLYWLWILNQRIFRVVHRGDFIALQQMRFGAILARSAEVSFSCKQIWRMVGEVSPVVQSTFYAFISWAMAGVLWAHKWTDSSCQWRRVCWRLRLLLTCLKYVKRTRLVVL